MLNERRTNLFEMANSLPYCVKKACQFLNCLHFFALSTNLFAHLKLCITYEQRKYYFKTKVG